MSHEDTIDCIESLRLTNEYRAGDLHVIVCDNDSPGESFDVINILKLDFQVNIHVLGLRRIRALLMALINVSSLLCLIMMLNIFGY